MARLTTSLAVLLCLSVLGARAAQQAPQRPRRDAAIPAPPVGSASVTGTVVNDLTGQPVRRATVTVRATDGGIAWQVVTTDAGAFTMSGLPAGRYVIGAARPGFVASFLGTKPANRPGPPVALGDGEARAGLTIRLRPGAVITGAVRSPTGEPIQGARIAILKPGFAYDTGQRTLQPAGIGPGEETDDRGIYRVFGLDAGDYYVVASVGQVIRSAAELRPISSADVDWAKRQLAGPSGGSPTPPPPPQRPVDYAPVFYPNASSSSAATVISLKEGEERSGIDVVSPMIPTAKIAGTIVRADGGPLPPGLLQVSVIAHETIPGLPFSGFGNTRADRTGHFTTAGLAPGDYTVMVRAAAGGRGGAAAPALFGLSTASVSGEDLDLTVTLQNGATVSGKLVFNGTTLQPPADLSQIRVSLNAVRGGPVPTLGVSGVLADGSGAFTIPGVTPGRYQVFAQPAGGWHLAQALIAGHDAADVPVEIGMDDVTGVELVFTDRQTELTGALLDAAGHPAPEYTLIVFPADQALWVPLSRRIESVRPASDGHFRVTSLPPGTYLLAAVTDVEPGQWNDPTFLAQLVSAATKVTLAEGESKEQNLKLTGG